MEEREKWRGQRASDACAPGLSVSEITEGSRREAGEGKTGKVVALLTSTASRPPSRLALALSEAIFRGLSTGTHQLSCRNQS